MHDIAALYSKNPDVRSARIQAFADQSRGTVIHIMPKNAWKHRAALPHAIQATYEDATKRETWLRINAALGPHTTLIFENPARYPDPMTEKSRALRRLSMQVHRKLIVDSVPFTREILYLYTPLSYLDRGILGYAHNYAWRENFQELGEDGVIRSAHDPDLLARKMIHVCQQDYQRFTASNRTYLDAPLMPEEHAHYATRKATLFATETSPQRIITRLADTSHAFASRTNAILNACAACTHPTVIYCNLASYAQRLQTAAHDAGMCHVRATSYQLGAAQHTPADVVIYAESPIVHSYFLLDIESRLCPNTTVMHVRSDAKVDGYLFELIDKELRQIDALTTALYQAQKDAIHA